MDISIRRISTVIDDKLEEAGRQAAPVLRKVAVIAVVQNPCLGRYVEDLTPLIDASEGIGARMAEVAMAAMGPHGVQSYGKAGIVGLAGEQEHANALLTTTFATPFRKAMGGGAAWISSMTKVAAPGAAIDVPMNAATDVYVRSHYDGMSLTLSGAPMPDEIALIFCLANRGRLNARVGGLSYQDSLATVSA
ncbi:amino acid synthesis family protein [Ancylobacter oerskovii]|uniref:Amino acid synthesis family protein n=1 Tax=Ancylobacter oerskovii TaxID=459519 RepID=A0ABW4Z173_9HYPH|nr:amino acid synthesis family protein [Ancylobacter oerskovii]MBS7542829.1 amino acid synthesis family protein [Ancylobacter oerskovii]